MIERNRFVWRTGMFLIYEEKAEYNSWIKLIFILPVVLFGVAISSLIIQDLESFLVLIGEIILFVLIIYFVMPRKYQIYQEKLRIVLGPPFGINIPFSTIKEVRHSSGTKAFAYSGIRFATSSRYVVEIIRSKGRNYIISPQNGEVFLEQFKQALKSANIQKY